jgi:hypothetical protein
MRLRPGILAATLFLAATPAWARQYGGRLELGYQGTSTDSYHSHYLQERLLLRVLDNLTPGRRLSLGLDLTFSQDAQRGEQLLRKRLTFGFRGDGLDASLRWEPRQEAGLVPSGTGPERSGWDLSVTATPRLLPRLRFTHARWRQYANGDVGIAGLSRDTRLGMDTSIKGITLYAEQRWLRSRSGFGFTRRVTETRYGTRTNWRIGQVLSGDLSYDGDRARTETEEVEETTWLHYFSGLTQLRLRHNLFLSSSAILRFTEREQKVSGASPSRGEDIDRSLFVRVTYRPLSWFTVSGLRERRTGSVSGQKRISDYAQARLGAVGTFLGRLRGQASLTRVWILESVQATTPSTSGVIGIQGPLYRGLRIRGHLTLSRTTSPGGGSSRYQNQALVEIRLPLRRGWEARGEIQTLRLSDRFRLLGSDRTLVRGDLTWTGRGSNLLLSYQRTTLALGGSEYGHEIALTGSVTGQGGLSVNFRYSARWDSGFLRSAPTQRSLLVQFSGQLAQRSTFSATFQEARTLNAAPARTVTAQLTRRF